MIVQSVAMTFHLDVMASNPKAMASNLLFSVLLRMSFSPIGSRVARRNVSSVCGFMPAQGSLWPCWGRLTSFFPSFLLSFGRCRMKYPGTLLSTVCPCKRLSRSWEHLTFSFVLSFFVSVFVFLHGRPWMLAP